MHIPVVGSFRWMKSLNRSIVLNTIRTHGDISRAEISKLTKLSPPTVTNIVNELLDNRLVVETELGESTGGRRPILLRIHADAYHVIGIDIGIQNIRAVVTNLNAEIKESLTLPVPADLTRELLIQLIVDMVKQLLERGAISEYDLMGIGIGMHGLVNPVEGTAVFAPNFGLRNIPLKKLLGQQLNVPIYVENDVVAFALGEQWFGAGTDTSNFIAINIGEGIGAGIVLNGQIYKGTSYSAGEIGHTTVDVDGPPCSCGNHGCLQSLASGPAIVRQAIQSIENGRSSLLTELCGGDLNQITGEMVDRAARSGDALALDILKQTGRYIGISLANLINTLNPRRIILGGGVTNAADLFLDEIQKTIQEKAMDTAVQEVSIMISRQGEFATAIGAVTIVLDNLFAPQASRT